MTAISGIWHFDGRPGALDRVSRMQAKLSLYARDRTGFWDDGAVALASGLTHTVPEDRFDRQPLSGCGGRITLVADVRIDNREALAASLNLSHDRVAGMADSALLLAGYEHWGVAVVERLVGPFCFAVWDGVDRTLTLVRDHFGVRPLFFHAAADWFAFSTMPKGLLALPEIPMRPDDSRMRDFSLLISRGTHSYFADIEGVDKGHVLIIRADGGMTSRQYWDPLAAPLLRFRHSHEYAEGLRETLTVAVRAMLRTDKAVGSYLSAGYDSSAITAGAARVLAERNAKLTAFTAVPRQGSCPRQNQKLLTDEGPIAALVAARYSNIHHRLVTAPQGRLIDVLDRHFFYSDRPLLNPVGGPWMDEILQQARNEGIGVLLTGEMGNCTISFRGNGYFLELVQGRQWLELAKSLAAHRGDWSLGRMKALKLTLRWGVGEARWGQLRRLMRGKDSDGTAGPQPGTFINRDRFMAADTQARLRALGLDVPLALRPETRQWQCDRMLGPDLANFDKGDLAAFGIDCRHPAIDLRVARFCLGVPLREQFRDGRFRGLFRSAFSDWLPSEVIQSDRTGYQNADWHLVMKEALPALEGELTRMAEVPEALGLFDLRGIRETLDAFPSTDDGADETSRRFCSKLSRAVSGLHFLRRASGRN